MAINDDLFQAAQQARDAAIEDANEEKFVGDLVSIDTDDRIATYLFEASLPGYHGWRWAITAPAVIARK